MKKNDSKNEFISLLGRFFTEYLPVSVNASPNTIASYKCAFRLLFQYLNEETDIKIGHITFEALDFELLTKYFDWLITTRMMVSCSTLSFSNTLSRLTNRWICSKAPSSKNF